MIERAVTAAVPFSWVAGDEVYRDNGPLRGWLEEQGIAYVLAVACHHRDPAGAGRALRADELAARLPKRPGSGCRRTGAQRGCAGTAGPGPPSATPDPAAGTF
jgi:SRSO17 transposase